MKFRQFHVFSMRQFDYGDAEDRAIVAKSRRARRPIPLRVELVKTLNHEGSFLDHCMLRWVLYVALGSGLVFKFPTKKAERRLADRFRISDDFRLTWDLVAFVEQPIAYKMIGTIPFE